MLNPHVNRIHVPAHLLGAGALAYAFATFDMFMLGWALLSFFAFNLWFSGIGMSIGFHRYFTHKAFKANLFWRYMMLAGGTLAGQGSVIFWAALHRIHHVKSDRDGDIHSPVHGFWHSYMGWIFTLDPGKIPLGRAVDLVKDPACKFTHRNYHRILWAWWAVLLITGAVFPKLQPLVVGALIAGTWSIHQEALINSICHHPAFGQRDYETKDTSRNVYGLHWLTWGQSLHNTHHAFPARADFGVAGPDIGYRLLSLFKQR